MGLKGTLTLIKEGWHLFYNNLGVIWKQSQFSFWMSIVSTIVLAGSIVAWAVAHLVITAANSGATTATSSSGISVLNVIFVLLSLAAVVATIIFTMSYSIAFTKTLGQIQGKVDINTKDKYKLVLPVLGVSLLTGLIVCGGFILLIVPAIIFWVWFAFSTFARMIDEKKGLEALRYSRSLSKGRFWKVLGRLLLINIILGIIYIIMYLGPQLLAALLSSMGNDSSAKTALLLALLLTIPVGIIFTILQILFAIFMVAILIVFYFNLKETMNGNNPAGNPLNTEVSPVPITLDTTTIATDTVTH